jgi:phosphoribosylanthranilate isomerase
MKKYVFPVIHQIDAATSLQQANVAFAAGADGVFLISHSNDDDSLIEPAMAIKGRYKSKMIGVNFLSTPAEKALATGKDMGLDMIWSDSPGVSSEEVTDAAHRIAAALTAEDSPIFFGSVAFKYQKLDPNPAGAAVAAALLGMLPTTSGLETGAAPDVQKIMSIRRALGTTHPLAVASGMTPANVRQYTPYVTHYLVATGVSIDDHHFDQEKLSAFIRAVHSPVAQIA